MKSPKNLGKSRVCGVFTIVDNVDKNYKMRQNKGFCQEKNPHFPGDKIPQEDVDNVDNYIPSKVSPISTTFPAPIVINRSPLTQFFNKNFSISSKEGK